MGIPISLILIAVGAILAFAVREGANASVDVDVVGWILMAVGLAGLLISLLWWERFGPGYWGWHGGPSPAGGAPYPPRRSGYGRRRTVVEEDEPPGLPGPPPP